MRQSNQVNPLLASIRNDIRLMGQILRQFSETVVKERISQYPIYVAHNGDMAIGRPFLDRSLYHTNWWYNASHLEEFVKKGLVEKEKVADFRATYGDPEERACIFLASAEGGGFVFVPYQQEDEEENEFKL